MHFISEFFRHTSIRSYGTHREMGCHTVTTVYNHRHGCHQLYRCNLKRLSERNRCQFHRPHIFCPVHNRSGFSRQIHTGFIHKSKMFKIIYIAVHAQPAAYGNKYRITGIHNSFRKSFTTMPYGFMTANSSVFYHNIPGTIKTILRTDHAFFQTCRRGYNFKSGTRLVSIIDTTIPPHRIQCILIRLSRRYFRTHCQIQFIGTV